jgi:hypothetical protein
LKRWSLAAVVVLALVGIVVARRSPPSGAPVSRPALAVRAAPRPSADDQAVEDRATALAVASLSPGERQRLLDAMDHASTRLEATLLPGADDLGDGDPVAELQKETKKYLPALNAARSLTRGRWSANDFSARAVSGCDDPSIERDETCVPLWSPAEEGSRARFLAWAAANAAVFETDAPHACAEALRDGTVTDGAPIALVLVAEDLALTTVPERPALEAGAHRLGRALALTSRKEESHQLDALGRAPPTPGRALSWLEVGPKAMVVVPRLSALTRLGELDAAVLRSPSCRPERWIHRAGG